MGPFHDKKLYKAVNYMGTQPVIDACHKHHVPKLAGQLVPRLCVRYIIADGAEFFYAMALAQGSFPGLKRLRLARHESWAQVSINPPVLRNRSCLK